MRAIIPSEFVEVASGSLVRQGWESEARTWLDVSPDREPAREPSRAGTRDPARDPSQSSPEGGRGGARALPLRDGGRAWLRRYRHGGLLGRILGDVYWQRPPRPWRELVVTEAARRAGVLAPEVLAAAALPIAGGRCGLYRALLVTRELSDRRSLAAALRGAASADERGEWIDRAWQVVEQLHAAGIRHPDLNVTNFLVAGRDDAVAVIDFDRDVAGSRPVGVLGRFMARRRFARSVAKLGFAELDRARVARHLAVRGAGAHR